MSNIAIVGGGIAGLVAAYQAVCQGNQVSVFEKKDVFGGQIAKCDIGGVWIDSGAESFSTRNNSVISLLKDMGLSKQVVAPIPQGAWIAGEEIPGFALPLPSETALGIPAHPMKKEVRKIVGWSGAARACLDKILPASYGVSEGRNLADIIVARLGSKVAKRLVLPVLSGVYQSSLTWKKAFSIIPGLLDKYETTGSLIKSVEQLNKLRIAEARPGSTVAGIKGGNHELVTALINKLTALKVNLYLNSEVLKLVKISDSSVQNNTQFSWLVSTHNDLSYRYEKVLLAGSLMGSINLLTQLGLNACNGLKTKTCLGTNVLILLLKACNLDNYPRGTGLLTTGINISDYRAREIKIKAVTHSNAKWSWLADELTNKLGPHHHILRVYISSESIIPEIKTIKTNILPMIGRLFGVDPNDFELKDYKQIYWPCYTLSSLLSDFQIENMIYDIKKELLKIGRIGITGAWVANTGLATVIPNAITTVNELLTE